MTGFVSPPVSEPAVAGAGGLSEREAAERLLRFGPNELPRRHEPSIARRIAHQAAEPLSSVLLAAAVVSAFVLDQPLEGMAIASIVVLNVAIGTFEERRAAAAVAALEALAAPTARVRRAGVVRTVPAADLVPGDVVEVAAGDRVPADIVVDDAWLLAADEALITGESFPANKTATDHRAADGVPLGDRHGELFAGTSIVRGRAVGTVIATGPGTVLGTVAGALGIDVAPPPPVGELRRVAARMSIAAVILGALAIPVVFVRAHDENRPLVVAVLAGVALAVAAIPEGLATVVIGALAIGARRMADHGAIVRRLPAIEALGSADIICTDKTGTITTGQLAVARAVAVPGREHDLWLAVARCNDSHDGEGDPIDVVLARAAADHGVERCDEQRTAEQPFDTETRCMAVVHRTESGPVLSLKGAPEVVFERCAPGPSVDSLVGEVGPLAAAGMRVIGVAAGHTDAIDADGLEPLGIVAFHDPLRESAVGAIERCRQAGIRVVLVTGDHVATATTIAAQAGIVGPVVSGDDLRGLSVDARRTALREAAVVARVDPATKLDLIQAHQSAGCIVAMTGDGVNDAPALQAADVGVAIAGAGGRGTTTHRSDGDRPSHR